MARDMSQLTPLPETQERLRAGMAKVIKQRGWETFVAGILVEPSNRCFPDVIKPNVGGVRLLIYRLMVYAGLEDLRPALELHDSGGSSADRSEGIPIGVANSSPMTEAHQGTESVAGWFEGIDDGTCHFGLDIQQTLDVDGLTGVLSHEVCHAYRNYHRIEVSTQDVEEGLTDLTTVYLGFGILSANASYRYRSGGGLEGGWTSSYMSEHSAGYLDPQDLCYLLALQAVIRDAGSKLRDHIMSQLDTTQRAMFSASHTVLSPLSQQLREELGIPLAESTWPTPKSPEDSAIAAAMKQFESAPGDSESVVVAAPVIQEVGRPTFRVVKSDAFGGTVYGAVVGSAAAYLLTVEGSLALSVFLLAAIAGGVLGRRSKHYLCSEPACKHAIKLTDDACPGCRRVIGGNIKSEKERLAAEESMAERTRES